VGRQARPARRGDSLAAAPNLCVRHCPLLAAMALQRARILISARAADATTQCCSVDRPNPAAASCFTHRRYRQSTWCVLRMFQESARAPTMHPNSPRPALRRYSSRLILIPMPISAKRRYFDSQAPNASKEHVRWTKVVCSAELLTELPERHRRILQGSASRTTSQRVPSPHNHQ
jgi:hypothetical protein